MKPNRAPQSQKQALGPQAANGSRTRDLKLGKLALYQLSYRRAGAILWARSSGRAPAGEVCGSLTGASAGTRPLRLGAVKPRPLPILISLAGACLIGLLIYGVSNQAANRTLDNLVAEGKRPAAPAATSLLPVLGGHGFSSLSSLRGKVVILNFWASWCPPCQSEAPLLQRSEGQLKKLDATVLGVTYKDTVEDSERFLSEHRLTYPNLRDTDNFASSYGTDQLPESFLIDRTGHIVALERGEIEQKFIAKAIALARST